MSNIAQQVEENINNFYKGKKVSVTDENGFITIETTNAKKAMNIQLDMLRMRTFKSVVINSGSNRNYFIHCAY